MVIVGALAISGFSAFIGPSPGGTLPDSLAAVAHRFVARHRVPQDTHPETLAHPPCHGAKGIIVAQGFGAESLRAARRDDVERPHVAGVPFPRATLRANEPGARDHAHFACAGS